MSVIERVFELEPGVRIGPFALGMPEDELPPEAAFEENPERKWSPRSLFSDAWGVKLYFDTVAEAGLDEAEVVEGMGSQVRLDGVLLLGRPVEEALADLRGHVPPVAKHDDPGAHDAPGWKLWAPDGTIASVLVERPVFHEHPPTVELPRPV